MMQGRHGACRGPLRFGTAQPRSLPGVRMRGRREQARCGREPRREAPRACGSQPPSEELRGHAVRLSLHT